jgi:hypothetical protein
MRRRRIVFAFIISTVLSLLAGLLSNLTATYLGPSFAEKPWIIYAALAVTFVISLPIALYLFLHSLPEDVSSQQVVNTGSGSPAHSVASPKVPSKSFRHLIGRDIVIGNAMAALRDPTGKWIIGMDGMGGIGKTALAREIVDRCSSERLFDFFVWEQAPRETEVGRRGRYATFTYENALDAIARQIGQSDVLRLRGEEKELRIRGLLQTRRVLVVLDNLETAKDSQDDLVRKIIPLLGPSKALLTSRHRFEGDVYSVHIVGLDEDSTLRFVRQEADDKGITRVSTAQSEELRPIYPSTGGSPLAIKLVVGQLSRLPLDTVLAQLRSVRMSEHDRDDDYVLFYKEIFMRSWTLLAKDSQSLLIAMAHFAPGVGGTLDAIKSTSLLAEKALTPSIDELWRMSFLEVGETPPLNTVRYFLHPLTQYFVLSDIVKVV